ncbi:GH32 C-terminal domain-containing protein [Halalkalibacter sp. AB-rgal2]|uniref:GH32 C-terminal domain-containing protein n=1 Tax=Halalkalibacter sp. AB-rgal2 TaxID=3242695 RepID=UPI00359DDFA4
MEMSTKLSNTLIAQWSFEDEGKFTIDTIGGMKDSIHYVFHNAMFQPSRDIKRKKGIKGKALWFDGFSTYVQRKKEHVSLNKNELSVSMWIAPYSFGGLNHDNVAALMSHNDQSKKRGFLLGIKQYGYLTFQLGLERNWEELMVDQSILSKNKWTYVVATYHAPSGEMIIYENGKKSRSKKVEAGQSLLLANEDLLIGKPNDPQMIEGTFALGMFSGLMDEVCLFSKALSEQEVLSTYQAYLSEHGGKPPSIDFGDLVINRQEFILDRHRPQYHLSPPGHWMNEPHAPFFYKGKYHLFYQHNPQGPYWGNIHWGHWVSEDMIHWKDLPIALSPELESFDPDGVWSGCAHYDDKGLPVLFFTAGNHQYIPNQMIGLARCTIDDNGDPNFEKWEKYGRPILYQPKGYELDDEGFRDPFVWKEGDTWYQLVGSGIKGRGGTALLFESKNLLHWKHRGPLYISDYVKFPYLGKIWELPILLPLGQDSHGQEKHLFIISPVDGDADVEVYYWVGEWDFQSGKFIPDFEEPHLFDVGDFHFTGPSAMIDPTTKRIILFTIAQGERPLEYEYASGWAHNGGLPIHVFLGEDDRIRFKPIDEVEALRESKLVDLKDITVEQANETLQFIEGEMLEIVIRIKKLSSEQVGLYFRQSKDRVEETLLYYDHVVDQLIVDRTKTTLDKKEWTTGMQGGKVGINQKQPIQLRIFLDKSIVEAYINDLKSLTTRVYPTREDAVGISIMGGESQIIKSIQVWRMKSIYM